MLNRVRELAGVSRLTELPKPKIERIGIEDWSDYKIEKLIIESEDGIYLPALMFMPRQMLTVGVVLYVHENGKDKEAGPGGAIEKMVKAGRSVLAVDLRGTGETQQTGQKKLGEATGFNWKNLYMAYLLGRSYVGMLAEDIMVCARYLKQQQDGPVDLVAVGHVSVPALHAAALEPDMFGSVKLVRGLVSWSNLIESGRSKNQLVNTVHGALTVYDLPDLAATLRDKLTTEEPLNALGEAITR